MAEDYNDGWDAEEFEKDGPTRKLFPPNEYAVKIKKATRKQDKNKKDYYGLELEIVAGTYKGDTLYDNYLPLDSSQGQFRRTKSLIRSLLVQPNAQNKIVPPQADAIEGALLKVRVENRYSNVEGHDYDSIETWSRDFKKVKEAGGLKNASAETSFGFYTQHDDFEGLGSAAADEDLGAWGEE